MMEEKADVKIGDIVDDGHGRVISVIHGCNIVMYEEVTEEDEQV